MAAKCETIAKSTHSYTSGATKIETPVYLQAIISL